MNQSTLRILFVLLSTVGCQSLPNSLVSSVNSFPSEAAVVAEANQTFEVSQSVATVDPPEVDSKDDCNDSHEDLLAESDSRTLLSDDSPQAKIYRDWLRSNASANQAAFHLKFAQTQLLKNSRRPNLLLGQDDSLAGNAIDPTQNRLEPIDDYPGSSMFTSDFADDSQLDFPTQLSVGERVMQDYRNFYSRQSLMFLGSGFLAGAVLAHTKADQELNDWIYGGINQAPSDNWREFLHGTKDLGDGTYTLPVFAGAWAFGELFAETPGMETVGDWGERSIRGFIVGAPFVAATQLATGGSRPYEVENASHWRPFSDDNGVSGHSFMGALPFLTAAMMTEDVRWKSAFFLASFATPLSRVSDGAHYPSQIFLGWWAAYAASQAVSQTDDPNQNFRIMPYFAEEGSGVMFQWDY